MNEDIAGDVHRKYYGKSDKLNAPENQNREFQDGYRTGACSMAYNAEQVLKEDYSLREEVGDDTDVGFDEFKRRFRTARSQCILFVSPRRRRKCDKFYGEASDK